MKIVFVTLANPCSACLIASNLQFEVLERLAAKHEGIEIEQIKITHLSQMKNIPDLEIEKFPAVISDGDQITAGSLCHLRRLEKWLGL